MLDPQRPCPAVAGDPAFERADRLVAVVTRPSMIVHFVCGLVCVYSSD